MTIRVRCPHCRQPLAFPETQAGQAAQCEMCEGRLRVPHLLHYECAQCGHRYQSSPHHAGRTLSCRRCGARVRVPDVSRPAPSDRQRGPAAAAPPTGAQTEARPRQEASPPPDEFSDAARDRPRELLEDVRRQGRLRRAGHAHAGFWRRAGAFILDSILIGCVGGVLGAFVGFGFALAQGGEVDQATLAQIQWSSSVLGMLVRWLYFAGLESSAWQATLGKKLFGMCVVDEREQAISFLRASVRHWAKLISGCLCFLGYLMVAWHEEKQGLHDIIAGTYVVLEGE